MGAETKGYAKLGDGFLGRLARRPAVAVASHWLFQSVFYMDRTERTFKLGLELTLLLAFGMGLAPLLPAEVAWLLALVLAHSVNFLCNGHLWGALKHYGLVQHSYEEFDAYVQHLGERVRREPSILRSTVIGSVSRGAWKPTSDIDVRLVRRAGLSNGLRACWFVMGERTRALLAGFPLDMYVLDNVASHPAE